MAISKELQNKLDYYEQVYYSLDLPVPFKGDLKIYPVLVKDYYTFYSCFNCITQDKNVTLVPNEFGGFDKIPNIKGIGQSYLAYLIEQINDPEKGSIITSQIMQLFELVFHIPKSLYCPECKNTMEYSELFEGMDEHLEQVKQEVQEKYDKLVLEQQEKNDTKLELSKTVPEEIMNKILISARHEYINKKMECPHCHKMMRDIFSIKDEGSKKIFVVKDIEIDSQEFDEFKAVVARQNILDYDGDKYIDPELKEELELKSQLQNKDYTSPTLEKQLVCVSIGTGIELDKLKEIPMRKLSMYLRLVDRKDTYYAQLQASMSGMVEFKEPPKHWIFNDDARNIKDELTSLDNFEKKFERIT